MYAKRTPDISISSRKISRCLIIGRVLYRIQDKLVTLLILKRPHHASGVLLIYENFIKTHIDHV
jgi:hypothetical protein